MCLVVPMQELLNLSTGHNAMFFIKVDDRTDIERPTKFPNSEVS